MNEQQFWEVIELVKSSASSAEERPDFLTLELKSLSADEIKEFDEVYFDQIIRSYKWDLWGAAYVINGGCSDDGFKYFCDFLISEGKDVFESALSDPESLALLDELEEPELEGFSYVAAELYEEKAGKELPEYSKSYPEEPIGEPWDEETVDKLYPKLAAKYW